MRATGFVGGKYIDIKQPKTTVMLEDHCDLCLNTLPVVQFQRARTSLP